MGVTCRVTEGTTTDNVQNAIEDLAIEIFIQIQCKSFNNNNIQYPFLTKFPSVYQQGYPQLCLINIAARKAFESALVGK